MQLTLEEIKKNFGDSLGEDDYLEPLNILLDSLKNEAKLSFVGDLGTRFQINHQLKMRSSLFDYSQRNKSSGPKDTLFITGLPRSGTTYLLHLLSLDRRHRSPLFWEIRNPFPAIEKNTFAWRNRIRRTRLEFKTMKAVIPDIDLLHEMGPELPEECLLIHPLSMRSLSYVYMAHVPSYGDYLKETDFQSAFMWHKRFVNYTSRGEEESRWLFKDPNHLRHMKEISETYKGAKFIRIKRDPKESLASICSLTYKVRQSFSKAVSKKDIGMFMLDYWEDALNKYASFKADNNRVIEVDFEELIQEPVSWIKYIYKEFNYEWTSSYEESLIEDLKNKKESKKKHIYSLEEFGLKEEEVEKRLSI
ncbi:MAG: sulfotransferase family protein [Gammaproteobacteria bacterium]